MKVCILGSGLTSLTLAKTLVNQGIYVDIFLSKSNSDKDKTRTIGISKTNIDFFNKYILNIEKLLWDINKIEIYSENFKNEKILNFQNSNNKLFSILKNFELFDYLYSKLIKDKLCNFKKDSITNSLLKKNYDLFINCDFSNSITKKFFQRQIKKNYNSFALTSTIKHKKVKNNTALQIFTSKGPLAFLPISKNETSVVYSIRGEQQIDLNYFIKKYNKFYEITKFGQVKSFYLKSSNLRSYYYKNVLAFGDLLHKLHPLAGQGFNMTIRDIREILNLIKLRKNNGLALDSSICEDFEKNLRHKNIIFSSGIDFIYEFFNLESKMKNQILSRSVKLLGKNKLVNNFFTNIADNGLII